MAPGSKSASVRGTGGATPLVVFPKRPPRSVVVRGLGLPGEYLPSPLVDQKAEGEEGHLIKSRAELERDVGLGGRDGVDQVELLEVLRSDGEGDRVANGLVEPVVGAVAKQKRKIAVGALILVMAFFVMDCHEIVGVDVDAHLDAQVQVGVHIQCARVTFDVAIAGANELGALVERFRKGIEPE